MAWCYNTPEVIGMDAVSLLIKPASGLCDMRCRYCFYEDVSDNRTQKSYGLMAPETAEILVRRLFERPRKHVSIAFQGGEPTLAGIEFYQRFTALVGEYNTRNSAVAYSIQTNGYCLDGEWAEFFAAHRFLVGISLDGPAKEHNGMRPDAAGRGTFGRVTRAIRLLETHGVEFNILCVVTGRTARHGRKLYEFFKREGFRYLQFIPCLDPLEGPRGGREYSLTPERYGTFLRDVFDCWYRDWAAGNYTSVRLLDDYVHILCGRAPGTCASSGACGQYFLIEADGGVYPCDFYVLDEWRMGDIREQSFEELAQSPRSKRFLEESHRIAPECMECQYRSVCRGGCRRDKIMEEGARNYFCPAFRSFFDYAMPRLRTVAREELRASGRAPFAGR